MHPKVVIVVAKCVHSKQNFGIRFEERRSGEWMGDWAFSIKETAAQREGYDRNSIAGQFGFDEKYPGCPNCESKSIVKCGNCGKIACWDENCTTHLCPWCSKKNLIDGQIEMIRAQSDR
jgi:hypothetical protein